MEIARDQPWAALGIAAAACGIVFLPTPAAIAVILAVAVSPVAWYAFSTRWAMLFLGAAILLPPLPIGFGDTGPNVNVALACLGLLAGIARLREWNFSFGMLPAAMVSYGAALLLSVGFAIVYSGLEIGAGSAVRVALLGISIYVFFASRYGPERMDLPERTKAARMLFWVALVAAGFGCVDFVLQLPAPAGFEPQFLWLDSGVYRRAQGLFYEASTLGNFCGFFTVMTAATLATPKDSRLISAPAAWMGLVVFGLAMLLSFSRASVLACGIALAAMWWIVSRNKARTLFAGLFALVLVAIVLASFLPEIAEGYLSRLNTLGSALESPDRVLSGRLDNWRTIGSFISDHPWQVVLGVGYKTLAYSDVAGEAVIADNAYLSALVECGVFGLLALLALNAAILRAGWRAMRQGSFFGRWIFCFWIGEVFQMLSGDILTYWRVLPVYFWVLAQADREAHERPVDRPVW